MTEKFTAEEAYQKSLAATLEQFGNLQVTALQNKLRQTNHQLKNAQSGNANVSPEVLSTLRARRDAAAQLLVARSTPQSSEITPAQQKKPTDSSLAALGALLTLRKK